MTYKTKHGDYDAMYGGVDYAGKVVLDIGADEGSTAVYFLLHGAKQVVCSEKNPAMVKALQEYAAGEPRVVVQPAMESAAQVEGWLRAFAPEVAKVDVEGAEVVLWDVVPEALRMPAVWVIETHSRHIHANTMALFSGLGYAVRVVKEWGFNPEVKVMAAERTA